VTPAHLYIHFPYCLYKCRYCDFNSYAYERAEIPGTRYAAALVGEIRKRRTISDEGGDGFLKNGTELATLFFGGGTPSLMNPKDVTAVLEEIGRTHPAASDAEITLESNPGTVNTDAFRAFREAGINRVSIGVQSFHDKYLGRFGRIHTGDEALRAIDAARSAGFSRVSCDLIFGFPGQTLDEWRADLARAFSLGLKHVSCYALTAEAGTEFAAEVRRGAFVETDPDLFADMQELTYEMTAEVGLSAYEISNFAVPGEECRHNLAYWRSRSYVGLGAGGVSQFVSTERVVRQTNHKVPDHYIRTLAEGGEFYVAESVGRVDAMKEFVMMGLRLRDGISLSEFLARFGSCLEESCAGVIARHVAEGSLILEADRLRPTRTGFLRNNAVVSDFFAVLKA
jgi:oxygen-independent coproporphyrinogen-3 oxidase